MEKLRKSEGRIQQECITWFRNNYCLKNHSPRFAMFSVPNEGKNAKEQMNKKNLGLMAGVSDTIIVLDNRVIFCEFKDEIGEQSLKQKEFQQIVKDLGHEYWLIRSLEFFENKLIDELKKNINL